MELIFDFEKSRKKEEEEEIGLFLIRSERNHFWAQICAELQL